VSTGGFYLLKRKIKTMSELYRIYWDSDGYKITKTKINLFAEDAENFIVSLDNGDLNLIPIWSCFKTLKGAKAYITKEITRQKDMELENLKEIEENIAVELEDLEIIKENIAIFGTMLIETEQITEADVH